MKKIVKTKELNEFFTAEDCYIREVLNQAEYPHFSIARARVLKGVTTKLHRLKDTHEVYYILSGTGEMEIDGIVCGTMEAEDMVFIDGNKTQRIKNTGDEDLVFLCICNPRFKIENYTS